MPQTRTMKLERLVIPNGEGDQTTARFFVRPGSRNRPWIWLNPAEVPPFDGAAGWFELERIQGRWKVLRQVSAPGRA